MLNTYIKNQGVTKTFIRHNNHKHMDEVNWNADYDGDIANIIIQTNSDGKRKQYGITLDNEDLANILNVPSIDMPIDKRLELDFQQPQNEIPEKYLLELPTKKENSELDEFINSHISSPKSSEEFIVPLTINRNTKKHTSSHRKRGKSHVTHKVYKKRKTSRLKHSKSKSNSRSRSKKTTILDDLF
jgi:hypothetical protein